MKPTVSIAHASHIPESPLEYTRKSRDRIARLIAEAVGRICSLDRLVRHRTVLIKPNLVRPNLSHSYQIITDPRVVEALVCLLRDAQAGRIVIGENPGYGMSSRYAFRSSTLRRRLSKWGVEFSYFDEEPAVCVPNRSAVLFRDVLVPRSVLEAEVFLNVPKLKTHMQTLISVGIKNLHGITYDEQRLDFHRGDLDQKIVDIYRIRKPTLTIVDGIWATEGQAPLFGQAIKDMNVIVAGRDTVAVDAVCARLMGIEPEEVGMLRLARFDRLGVIDAQQIRVVGVPVEQVRRPFRRPILGSTGVYPGVRVVEGGACSGCLSSLRHSLDKLANEGLLDPSQNLNIWIGCPRGKARFLASPAEGEELWLFGDCLGPTAEVLNAAGAADPHGNGKVRLVRGCPPHVLDFAREFATSRGVPAAKVPKTQPRRHKLKPQTVRRLASEPARGQRRAIRTWVAASASGASQAASD